MINPHGKNAIKKSVSYYQFICPVLLASNATNNARLNKPAISAAINFACRSSLEGPPTTHIVSSANSTIRLVFVSQQRWAKVRMSRRQSGAVTGVQTLLWCTIISHSTSQAGKRARTAFVNFSSGLGALLDLVCSNLHYSTVHPVKYCRKGRNKCGPVQEMVKMWTILGSVDGVAVVLLNHRIVGSNGVQNSINSVLNTNTDQVHYYFYPHSST